MTNSKKLTFSAIMLAFTVVILYFAAISPTAQLGLSAVSSLLTAAVVISCGNTSALIMFCGAAVLSFLILPEKTPFLLYVVFFGWYAVVKSMIERKLSVKTEWIVKVFVLELCLTVLIFLLKTVLLSVNADFLKYSTTLIYLVGTAAFVLYDIGFSKLIDYYMSAVLPKINK